MLTTAQHITTPSFLNPGALTFIPGEQRIFRRKENLTVSQNAAKYRIVTNGPRPGRWENNLTPYLVEPMDTLNLPWVRQVILQFAPQTGKTQVPINFLAYAILQDPGPCMYVMPDEKLTKRTARRSLLPMFRNSPRIAELMSPVAADTTHMSVHFIHGMDVMMAWATSAAEMASESVRYLIRDETDKFPDFTGKEADPRALSDQRTNAYPDTCKIIDLSTPTDETGHIGRAMETEADEVRHYWAVCPICKEAQVMVFAQFNWPASVRDPREII
ncbi:MAG: phage terminase large subunit family protein, partial [Candidatus Omnitrophota bacterium]|nr:phage terminase large subunit family protein [Candidatus Omnitrophota bacterium]